MRFLAGVIVFSFLIAIPGMAAAQSNLDLIDRLNAILALQMKSLRQCEVNSEHYKSVLLYLEIMREKEQSVSDLKELILQLRGTLSLPPIIVTVHSTITQALNQDGRSEIELIRACDGLLAKYGHPKARQTVQTARAQAIRHFMSFSSEAQALLIYAPPH